MTARLLVGLAIRGEVGCLCRDEPPLPIPAIEDLLWRRVPVAADEARVEALVERLAISSSL